MHFFYYFFFQHDITKNTLIQHFKTPCTSRFLPVVGTPCMLMLPWDQQQMEAVFQFFLLPFWGMSNTKRDVGNDSPSLYCRPWLFCPKYRSEQSQLFSALLNRHKINCRYTWFTLILFFDVLHVHITVPWRSSAPKEGKRLQKAILPIRAHLPCEYGTRKS